MNSEIVSVPDDLVANAGAFAWFTGVVEDIADPKEMGRVRVRCFGYHTTDKSQIPTEKLPWAMPMMPVSSASMSGIGRSATGILQGSWVIGFFQDGPSAQFPIIMGTVPSISTGGDATKGFADPAGINPTRPGEVDTPVEARSAFTSAASYVRRNDLRQEKIETAVPPKVTSVATDEDAGYYVRPTWSNLETNNVVRPIYPYNHVVHTQAGHVFEVDDSAHARRIFEMHASGTYREIDDAGDLTQTIVGDKFTVVVGANNVYVKGACNVTIDSDCRLLVKGNYHLEVRGNMTEYITGSKQTKIGQSEHKEIGNEWASNVTANHKERVGGDTTIIRDGYREETIGDYSKTTISGLDTRFSLDARHEYVDSHLEVSTNGHLFLTSKQDTKLETPANMTINVDGDVNETVGGKETIAVNGGDLKITTSGVVDMNP